MGFAFKCGDFREKGPRPDGGALSARSRVLLIALYSNDARSAPHAAPSLCGQEASSSRSTGTPGSSLALRIARALLTCSTLGAAVRRVVRNFW